MIMHPAVLQLRLAPTVSKQRLFPSGFNSQCCVSQTKPLGILTAENAKDAEQTKARF
jgi:hypothetical protein